MSRACAALALLSILLIAPFAAADHGPGRVKAADELTVYHTWPVLTRELQALAAAHGDIMTLTSVGKSVLGLDLWGVHLSAPGIPVERRERVYIDGGTHANEQLGMELAFHMVKWLVEGYGSDPEATWILENREVYVIPMVNPDGNMRDTRMNTHLVDLNRNFPYAWGGPGSGDRIGGFDYRGPSPASEPETQTVVRAMTAFDPDYVMTYHTGITMFIHPWGANATAMEDQAVYDGICAAYQAWDTTKGVECGNAEALLYATTGATDDFAYGALGAIAFTFEVDDEQFNYVSLETIQTRLIEAWDATRHGLLYTERYGNLPTLVDITRAGDLVTLTVTNTGYGDAARNVAKTTDAAGAMVDKADLGRLAPGESRTVTLQAPPGDAVGVRFVYERQNRLPSVETRDAVLDLARYAGDLKAALVVDGGLPLAPSPIDAPLKPTSVDGEAGLPAPGLFLAALAVLAAAIVARRR